MANLAVDATAQEQSILDIETKLADLDNAVKNINATNTQILAIWRSLLFQATAGAGGVPDRHHEIGTWKK